MGFRRIAASLLTVSVLTASSQAAVIATDDFESYSAGALNTASGGSGWTSSWTAVNGIATQTSAVTGGGNLAGEIVGQADGSNNSTTAALRRFAQQQSTVYFSVSFNAVAGLNTDDFVQFYLSNGTTNNSSGGFGKVSTDTSFIGARVGSSNGGTTVSSSTTIVLGTTYQLVGKISKTSGGNYNRIDLFINPTDTTEPALASVTQTGDSGVSGLQYFGVRSFQVDPGDRYQFDNVRIATTFAEAVVPEPAALALIGVVGFGLLRRRGR
jgi:hypothetical protein